MDLGQQEDTGNADNSATAAAGGSHYSDVVVVGAGNAALCAAMAALESGATVTILEKAPREERGGNSALTITMRVPADAFEELIPLLSESIDSGDLHRLRELYRPRNAQTLRDEIIAATNGKCDRELLGVYVDSAYDTIRWLADMGHRWVPSIDPTSHNPLMMEGRGYAYQKRNFARVERLGATIRYQCAAVDIIQDDNGRVCGVTAHTPEGSVRFYGKAVVLASGGFEANPEMRSRYLGGSWDAVHMRGVPFNTGDGLRMALRIGAMPYGGWGSCHASPQDWARPPHGMPSEEPRRREGGFGWSRYAYPYGILVNETGKRFVDEASGVRGMTYARIGGRILEQPKGRAFQIFDSKPRRLGLIPQSYDSATGAKSDTVAALAASLGVDPAGLETTINEFNAAVAPGQASPDPISLDGHGTRGLVLPKSNFAMPLTEPPFEGYIVRCGITFTFGGIRIDPSSGQVMHVGGWPIEGLYAAGEMVGGLFYDNYPGGSGMTSGSVFGRIAGISAARRPAEPPGAEALDRESNTGR